jgi:CO/xanthine dehydrogenase FAD-binding subunit
MKAADFDYSCPASVAEACGLLAGANGEGRIIAGGQTLVPMLAMRLARPALLVDITRIAELRGIARTGAAVAVKACTTQTDALKSEFVREHVSLLAKALSFVGHIQTRNRGTIGGSFANADPAAEIGMAAVALDAEIVARNTKAERTIPCGAFFRGAMTTALGNDECLTEARFPVWEGEGRVGTGFQEMSIRRSDFALVAAAVQGLIDESGVCRRIAIALGGTGGKPIRHPRPNDCWWIRVWRRPMFAMPCRRYRHRSSRIPTSTPRPIIAAVSRARSSSEPSWKRAAKHGRKRIERCHGTGSSSQ